MDNEHAKELIDALWNIRGELRQIEFNTRNSYIVKNGHEAKAKE